MPQSSRSTGTDANHNEAYLDKDAEVEEESAGIGLSKLVSV